MAQNIWDEFDSEIDTEGLRKDMEEAEKNGGGNYKEVPVGSYEVSVEKMELTKSKKGNPMVSIWFKIQAGEFKGQRIFYNQVVSGNTGIHFNNELLKAMGLECVDVLGTHDHEIFKTYKQYGGLLMDAAEEIDAANLTFALDYGEGKNGFHTYEITEVFEG